MANTKKRINQGIDTLFDFSLKIKVVTNANGIIQRARVSFTIVATSRAFARMLLLHRQQNSYHVWLLPPKVRIVLESYLTSVLSEEK